MRTSIAALILFLNAGHAQTMMSPAADHDFGVVPQGDRVSHAFALRNTDERPLKIDRVELDVSGATARFPGQVAPGSAAVLTVEWNTARETGDAEGFATVYANGGSAPHQVFRFRARIQPPIEFQPFPAVFFSAYTDEAPEKSVHIINHEKNPLVIREIDAPKRFDVKLDEVQPGREYLLRVQVRKGGAPGRSMEPIYLSTTSAERPRLQVNANLFVKSDLYAFPEEVSFGAVQVSGLQAHPQMLDFVSQSTVITNRGRSTEVRSVTSDLPFLRFTFEPGSGPSERFLLNVALDPTKLKPGEFRGSIRIVTSDPQRPEISIPVSATIL